jgi:hypothetical protein
MARRWVAGIRLSGPSTKSMARPWTADQARYSAPWRRPQSSALLQSPIFILLCAAITLASMISTLISVHLLSLLQARGVTLAAAVALGTIGHLEKPLAYDALP